MKARNLLSVWVLTGVLCGVWARSFSQVQPLGTVIGNQTVISIPIAPPGYTTAQALIYYPDDYFLPANANKRYPLFVFLHGAGEGSGTNITEVTNTSLPNLIANGLKPYGVDPATGDTIKYIVISPHCANCGASYSYPQLQYTIPYLMYNYRVDTSCVWVGGLSAGARGTWSVVMGANVGDTTLGKRITGILPMANGGYDNYIGTLGPNLDTIAKRGLACLYTIGDQDPGYNSIGFFAYQALMKTYCQPGRYFDSVVIGGTHSTNVWNPPFPETARIWSKTMNSWTQMWTLRKSAAVVTNPPPVVLSATASASNAVITLPANSVTLNGSATPATGTTIASYAWTQVSGGASTIASPGAASTQVTGLAAGTYVFQLTVTSSAGTTASTTVQVTVNPATSTPPVANAGLPQVITLPTSTATLTGTGTSASGTIASYAWTQTAGATATITTPNAATTTVTGLALGSYTFQLMVTDNTGATATSTVQVKVSAATPSNGATICTKVALTEYQCAWLYSDGVARSFVYNTTSGHVEFMPFLINGRKAVDLSTGFNRVTILDDQGYVWLNDAGKNTATRWNTDATGAPFNGNVSIYGYFYTYLSIRNDGSIWYWGGDDYKLYGGTAITQPVRLKQPAGVQFVKISAGNSILGLTTTGDVYQWDKGGGGNYYKVTLPGPATDIAASQMNFDLAVVSDNTTPANMGYPYAWGSESRYWGGDGSSIPPTAPVALKGMWQMKQPIQKITANQNVIHFIDALNDLYGIGDNPCGEVGNGEELVNHAEKYKTPYAWSWIKYEALTGAPPIHISVGTKFKDIFASNTFSFYHYALDVNDSLYFWGRNKSFVGGDGVVNGQESTWPNALDILKPTMRTPLGIKPTQTFIFNFTPYTLKALPASKQTLPVNTTSATLSAASTPSILVSAGQPNYGYTIVKYQWTQISGPNTGSISSPNTLTSTVTGLVAGTYIFSIQTTDNNTATITAYDTLIVNSSLPGAPVANAGPAQTITLPTNSATLTGSGSETNGTITGYSWTQVSGPNTANFGSAGQAVTTVSGLVQGVYVFQLTVTDNSGVKATALTQVTVNPAAGLPVANAGGNQTITLPTNSVTLTGSGSEQNGTIVSYSWTQVSGPGTANFGSAGQAVTSATGLVQGVYTFQLTVTDNSGVTATDITKVTVNPAVVPGAPVANAGGDQTITLPVNSATLKGTGSEVNGTIVSYSWTQISGPNTANFGSAGQATTGVSGMVQGVYVFQLTVKDNSGVTATDVAKVTVNPAVTPGTPVVSAGTDQTITLPTNSVTLSGTASEVNGTIVSYSWTQISGPTSPAATIGTPNQAGTSVTGLVQGVYSFQLTVKDNSGVSASDVVKVTVNSPVVTPGTPVANAGGNQTITLPTNSVTLTGSGSETNGTIVGYTWTQVSGPSAANIGTAGQAVTQVTGLLQGVYTFQLTVKDNSGVTATDIAKVTVNPAIVPGTPVANAGPDQTITLPTNSVTLSGSGSEVNGTIVGYTWSQLSGPSTASIGTSGQASTSVTGLVQGVYTFQLTVKDNSGVTAIDVMKVTVNPAVPVPGPPVADAGPNQSITLPTNSVTLSGSGSETNGTIVGYAWTQTAGPNTATIASTTQASTGVSGLVAGVYTFQLTVKDNSGVTATDVMQVTVNPAPPNQAPVAVPGPDQTVTDGATVYVDGSLSYDPDGTLVKYEWVQVSGAGGVTIAGGNSVTATLYGLHTGVYVFKLTVWDNQGASDSKTITITVVAATSQGPVAKAGNDTTITYPAQSAIQLNGSNSYDQNGTLVSYLWKQVSGPAMAVLSNSVGMLTEAGQLVPGDYVFSLTVTDDKNASASDTIVVHVLSSLRTAAYVKLFPNPVPAGQLLNVSGTLEHPGEVNLLIYDMNGRLLRTVVVNSESGNFNQAIPVNGLGKGAYVLKVIQKGSKSGMSYMFVVD